MSGLFAKLSLLFSKRKPAAVDAGSPKPALRHIGIIMDGNGRWAKKRGLPRESGHSVGAKVARRVIEHCIDLDIGLVTVYAFSTENWKRPQKEVDTILKLFADYLDDGLHKPHEKNSRMRFLGDRSRLSPETQRLMEEISEKSAGYPHQLNIAINYGGRDEIVRAVNTLIQKGKTEICEQDISDSLYTRGQPDPDLIIRTGGESRMSNFLLWQSAYSELYFIPKLWPDITEADIDGAIAHYHSKERRFGDIEGKNKC